MKVEIEKEFLKEIDIEDIKKIALKSGKAILKIYETDFYVKYKDDNSPLTEADIEANRIICESLKKLYPEIPILSEENIEVDYKVRKDWKYYWCIDPIDGTKEFVKKNGELTVNIALLYNNKPVLGVVLAPVLGDLYWSKKGDGAFKNGAKLPLNINKKVEESLTVVISHTKQPPELLEYIKKLESLTKKVEQISKGSSLKFCMVAEGKADIYPRFTPIREWDTAASHSILLEAGKDILQYENGEQVVYNKKNLLHPWFIVR